MKIKIEKLKIIIRHSKEKALRIKLMIMIQVIKLIK